MTTLAERNTATLRAADLNVRSLAELANVHYTTIYLILRKGEDANPVPLVEKSLNEVLDNIESLITANELPLPKDLSSDSKVDKLRAMFEAMHQ